MHDRTGFPTYLVGHLPTKIGEPANQSTNPRAHPTNQPTNRPTDLAVLLARLGLAAFLSPQLQVPELARRPAPPATLYTLRDGLPLPSRLFRLRGLQRAQCRAWLTGTLRNPPPPSGAPLPRRSSPRGFLLAPRPSKPHQSPGSTTNQRARGGTATGRTRLSGALPAYTLRPGLAG